MRKDVYEGVLLHIMNETKPNFAALAKRFNCDYRTVKRYYEAGVGHKLPLVMKNKHNRRSPINNFEEIIADKLSLGCSSTAIYHFISKKGYSGSPRTVRRYCRNIREDKVQKATIRIETSPGLSAQVDWKEEVSLITVNGERITYNIFLYVLGYSRTKYLEVTFDRSQDTLFKCLINAFEATGGIPEEIWFDNMKTVVDRSKTQFTKVAFNTRFRQFCKDAGFKPIACRPFRPQTKGKVEALARTVERLTVYNNELNNANEISDVITEFMHDLNREISQATGLRPIDRLNIEQKRLKPVPTDTLEVYKHIDRPILRKVSRESMISFDGKKYSVPTRYIGKSVSLTIEQNQLVINYDHQLIRTHGLSPQMLNYNREDYTQILRSDVFKNLDDEELERFVDHNLQAYDEL